MVQETVRQPVKAIRDRKHVPALQDPDSKAVRCLCTEEYRREDSLAETLKTIVGINVSALERFEDGATVSVETLIESGIVKNPRDGVKILGNGELTKKLTVQANAFQCKSC